MAVRLRGDDIQKVSIPQDLTYKALSFNYTHLWPLAGHSGSIDNKVGQAIALCLIQREESPGSIGQSAR